MTSSATATFDVTGWDQTPYGEAAGSRHLSRATVRKAFSGDLEGESVAELLMCQADASDLGAGAGYVASELVTGTLGGRAGTFVMQHWGVSGGGATQRTGGRVVPGSGTDELAGLSGTVEISVDENGGHVIRLDYQLPEVEQ